MLGDLNFNSDMNVIKNLEKDKGGLKEIEEEIKKELHLEKNTFTTWNGLEKFLKFFNETFEKKTKLKDEDKDLYFSSLANKYIFALTELDGEIRAKLLGITREHYSNLRLAKEWKNSIVKKIHPDICTHSEAQHAMAKLNTIYEGMIKYGK